MIKKTLFMVVLSLTAIIASRTGAEELSRANKWPTIQPTHIKTFLTSENSKVVLEIFSKSNPSEKLYILRCNRADSPDRLPDENEYYGMFQCHFLPVKSDGPELLEGEDGWNMNKSYNTRGVFTYEQLLGPCKNNPEFGLHREFNMRGMKLELTISDFSSPPMADMLTEKIKPDYSFNFEAKVSPNKSAISEYTSPSAKKYCGGYYKVNANGKAVYHESGH